MICSTSQLISQWWEQRILKSLMIFYRNTHILCLSRNWTDQKKTILYIFFLVGLTDFHAVSCFPVIWFSFYLWYQISGIQIPGIKNLWEILRKSFKRISSTRSNIWCFSRFGTICTILKAWKTTMEESCF